MELLFFAKPVLLVFPVLLTVTAVLERLLPKIPSALFFVVNGGLLSACLCLVFRDGGTLSDALLLLLFTAFVHLFLTPNTADAKPSKEDKTV